MSEHDAAPAGDYILRVLAKDVGVRAVACLTTEVTREAVRRHEASALASVALGAGLTAITLLGAQLKVQQQVALRVQGDGMLGKLAAESDANGHVRGYIEDPAVDAVMDPAAINLDVVATGLGFEGLLIVTKDLRLKELYEGVVPISGAPLDEELATYLRRSEQVPSLVQLAVRLNGQGEVQVAGGLLVQTLPGQDPALLNGFAERLQDLPELAQLLADGATPESLMVQIFQDLPYETLEKYAVTFRCSCSWQRSEQALRMLPREDLETLLTEGEAVVDCHFCHERYLFGAEVLEQILEEMDS